MARDISADRTGCSVSFNEYLTMMGNQKNTEPTPESLLDAFQLFDKEGRGRITVAHFRKIMMCKMGEDKLAEAEARFKGVPAESDTPPKPLGNNPSRTQGAASVPPAEPPITPM